MGLIEMMTLVLLLVRGLVLVVLNLVGLVSSLIVLLVRVSGRVLTNGNRRCGNLLYGLVYSRPDLNCLA